MKSVSRRELVKLVIRLFSLENLIQKLYPLAIEVKFAHTDTQSLLSLGKLLSTWDGPELQRMGSANDGGYLVTKNINPESFLLSFGVGDNVDFEAQISSMISGTAMFDHTVLGLPIEVQNGQFNRVGISFREDKGFTTIPLLLKKYENRKSFLMKIDIEGDEWDILDDLGVEELRQFSQIVGEFHNFHQFVSDSSFREKVLRVLSKLNQTHRFVSIHANNWGKVDLINGFHLPDVLEFTAVLQSDFELNPHKQIHSLHRPNNPERNEIRLGFLSVIP